MSSQSGLIVQSLFTCEFASLDAAGRPIIVGMHLGRNLFRESPPVLPAWYIVLIARPNARDVEFFIDFDAPDGIRILRLSASQHAEKKPDLHNRLVMLLQIPSVQFPGFGTYSVKVRDGNGSVLSVHDVPIEMGSDEPFPVQGVANVEVNERFLTP